MQNLGETFTLKAVATFLLLWLPFSGRPQNKSLELKLGLGGGSRSYIADGGQVLGFKLFEERYVTGPILIEGLYHFARFKTGISATYENIKVQETPLVFGGSSESYIARKTTTTTVLLNGYYTFIQKKRSSFYSGVAVGPAFASIKNYEDNYSGSNIKLGYQFTAIGFECHNKVGFFVEAGYGYKGVIIVGCSLQ